MTLRLSMAFTNSLALTLVDTLLYLCHWLKTLLCLLLLTAVLLQQHQHAQIAFTIAIITIVLASVPSRVLPSLQKTKTRQCAFTVLLLLLPLFTLARTDHCRQVKPLDFESTLRHSPPRRESKHSPLPRFSGYSLGRAKWPQDCQEASVGKTGPSLPTVCSSFTDFSCLMRACHSPGLSEVTTEDFTARVAVLNFGYGRCTPPFALDGFALSLSSLSARCGLSFCFTFCLHPAFYTFANLTIKMDTSTVQFLASSFDSRCHDLLHMSNPLGSSPYVKRFLPSFCLSKLFPSTCKLDSQKWTSQLSIFDIELCHSVSLSS